MEVSVRPSHHGALSRPRVGRPAVACDGAQSEPDPRQWMANGKIFRERAVRRRDVHRGNVQEAPRIALARAGPRVPQVTGLTGLAAIDLSTGKGIPSQPQITVSGNQTLEVQSLAIVGDTLYVGGQFSAVDGQPRLNIAAIDIDPTR